MNKEDVTDDRLIAAYIKMRASIADINKEYEARLKVVKDQQKKVANELLRRLQERKSKQTKTDAGTAFRVENMYVTIADEDLFGDFCKQQQDFEFYQKRVKVEHLKEYMKANGGILPPGLNVHREFEINVRAERKGDASGAAPEDDTTGDAG